MDEKMIGRLINSIRKTFKAGGLSKEEEIVMDVLTISISIIGLAKLVESVRR